MIVNLQRFIAEHRAQIEKSGLLRTIIKLWKVQLTFKDHYKNKLIELMYNKRIKKDLADVSDEDDVVNKNVEQQLYLFTLEARILVKYLEG